MRPISITTDMFNYSYQLGMETKLTLFASRGFTHIHWCDDWNNGILYSAKDMRSYCQLVGSSGLKCLDVHGSDAPAIKIGTSDQSVLKEYVRLLENRIEFCSAIGGDAVVVHPPKEASDLDRSIQANLYDNMDELMRFSSRLRVLHLHDNKGKTDDHQPPFWGTVDWQKVMGWVEKSGYTKPVNFEITHRPKYFEGRPEESLDHAKSSILRTLPLHA